MTRTEDQRASDTAPAVTPPDAPSVTPNPGAFSAFRHPVFRAIWIANLFSNLGATIQSVAAAWLMTELTSSHQLISAVQASTMLPIMLFGMVAGAIADNYDRRQVMLVAQIGMLLASAVLAALSYLQWITPGLLLAFTLSIGVGTALNSPAWQSSVRQTVPAKELPQAIALNSMSFNTARSVGPAVGGVLISVWDTSLAFAINAVSYIALIVVLLRWRPQPRRIARRPMLPAIGAGLAFCWQSWPIRRILMRGFMLGLGIAAYQALLPSVVRERLDGSEIDYGIMLAVFGMGSIVAAPYVGRLRRAIMLEGVMAASALIFVAVMSIIAEIHRVILAAPVAFFAGMAWVAMLTTLNTAIQLRSPDHILGRCLSIYQATTFGGMAIGAWLWGTLADLSSLPMALHAASALLVAGTILLRVIAPLPKPGEGVLPSE